MAVLGSTVTFVKRVNLVVLIAWLKSCDRTALERKLVKSADISKAASYLELQITYWSATLLPIGLIQRG